MRSIRRRAICRPRYCCRNRATSAALFSRHCATPNSSRSRGNCATRPNSTRRSPRARCCSRWRFRQASSGRCGAAMIRRCSSPPMPPTRWRPARQLRRCRRWSRPRWSTTAACPKASQPLFEIRTHERYNPAASTPLNIVPGLLGTILTLTMLIFTALSVTREIERGTMESLLAMPITPFEIMLGKIAPYVLVGFVQAALILGRRRAHVRRADRRQFRAARRAHHAVHRHQPVVRLHLLDAGAEPAAGDADVDDVLPAEHDAVRLHLPVPRHAALGAGRSANSCRSRITSASCARSCSRARRWPICSTTPWRSPA